MGCVDWVVGKGGGEIVLVGWKMTQEKPLPSTVCGSCWLLLASSWDQDSFISNYVVLNDAIRLSTEAYGVKS